MSWIEDDVGVSHNSCHSEPGAKPGEACPERSRREPAFLLARLASLLVPSLSIFALSAALAAQTPQELLNSGRADQAIQTLEQQIHTSPTAEAYNLLCRAHFELGAWDAGIPSCEKAVARALDNGLYHLWVGRIYGEKADRAGFLTAAGLAK